MIEKPRLPAVIALEDMALFVAVARALSFTKASAATGIPIATLSRRIANMERRAEVRLFERTTRQLALTGIGRRYFDKCERIVQEAEIAQEILRDAVEKTVGHLRVSTPVEFGLYNVFPVVEAFARFYPDITIDLDLTPRPVDLIEEGVDISIRLGELPDSPLVVRRLGSAERVLYASPQYLALHGIPKKPEDLADHSCIIQSYMNSPNEWKLVNRKRTMSVAVKGRFSTNNVSMCLKLAAQSHGIAALSPTIVRSSLGIDSVQQILDGWSFPPMPVHAVMTSRLMPARVRLFLEFLASRLEV